MMTEVRNSGHTEGAGGRARADDRDGVDTGPFSVGWGKRVWPDCLSGRSWGCGEKQALE